MLLQEIRFVHALAEKAKVIVTERELPALNHIAKYFDINYELGDKISYNVQIDHETPSVNYGEVKTLVFPKAMIRQEPKTIEYLFQGLMEGSRLGLINKFPNAQIISSTSGRVFPEKAYDPDYFDKMARTKFALIPNGVSFPWSYRFFEAVMSGAIPIVEEHIPLYKGYKYFLMDEAHEYREKDVKHNLDKFIRDCTL